MVLLWSPFTGKFLNWIERAIEVSVAANNIEVAALLHFSEFFLRHSAILIFPFFELANQRLVDGITDIRFARQAFAFHNLEDKASVV